MNVIVSNRQKEIIDNANIDAIKDLNGLFNVNDLISKFKNYFFSKMILDATSVVDFASKDVLSILANEIGAEKLIILLPSSPEPPLEFKKLLIELKIYNFTTSIDDVIRFIEKPNTYEDAIKTIDNSFSNDVYVDNSIKEGDISNEYHESNVGEINPIISPTGQSSLGDILNSLSLNSDSVKSEVTNLINENSENKTPVVDNDKFETVTEIPQVNVDTEESSNGNIFLINDDFNNASVDLNIDKPLKKIVGVKGVTTHAGCTSLIYMLHRMAIVNLKKKVLSIEVGKNDFRLFRDSKMISVNENNLVDIVHNAQEDIIFIDLNECNNYELCTDVLYLVEPSTIKLNELMANNRNIFKELREKKILLNKSLLSANDVRTLESEAGVKFFNNIEPLNDRIFNDTISKLLSMIDIQ